MPLVFPAWFLTVAVVLGILMISGAVVTFVLLLVRDIRSKTLW